MVCFSVVFGNSSVSWVFEDYFKILILAVHLNLLLIVYQEKFSKSPLQPTNKYCCSKFWKTSIAYLIKSDRVELDLKNALGHGLPSWFTILKKLIKITGCRYISVVSPKEVDYNIPQD